MCEHYGNYKSLYSTLVLSQSHIPYSVLECNSGGTTTVLDSFVLVSAMYPYAGYAYECSTSKVQQIFPLLFHSLTCTFTKTPCTTLHVCKLSTRLVSYLQYTHIHTHSPCTGADHKVEQSSMWGDCAGKEGQKDYVKSGKQRKHV